MECMAADLVVQYIERMEIRERDMALLFGAVLVALALLQLFRQRIPRITVSMDEGVERSHPILLTSFHFKSSHALKGGLCCASYCKRR